MLRYQGHFQKLWHVTEIMMQKGETGSKAPAKQLTCNRQSCPP